MDFVHPPERIGHSIAGVQPASGRSTRLGGLVVISGSLSPGSPAEAGESAAVGETRGNPWLNESAAAYHHPLNFTDFVNKSKNR